MESNGRGEDMRRRCMMMIIIIIMLIITMIPGLSGRRRRVQLLQPLSIGDRGHESSKGGLEVGYSA